MEGTLADDEGENISLDGRGWAALSSHASSSSQDECCPQEESATTLHAVSTWSSAFPFIQATIHTASKGKQKDVNDRSSVEVEQLLPPVEPVHDPRNFYASDSPMIEDPDSDDELYKPAEEDAENIKLDGQGDGEANESPEQRRSPGPSQQLSSCSAPVSHLPSSRVSHLPLQVSLALPQNSDRADHCQGELGGYLGTNDVQQGSQAYIIDLLERIARNTDPTRGTGSRGDRKVHGRRGRSPVRRTAEDNALAKSVRVELSLLFKDNPPYGCTPSPSRLSTFMSAWESSGHGATACETTTADFMVDIAGDPKSPWNVSVGRAFTDYFIEKTGRDDTPEMRRAVEKAFDTRIRSLKSHWKRDKLPQAAKVAERSKHSRRQRKYQLFQRRREITKLYDPLKRHLGVLDVLGVDGMSSDESSFDPHTIFDELHHRNRANGCILDKRGMFTHIRAGSQKIRQTSHAPPNLPLNAYDPGWLESREGLYVKHELRPIKDPYIFNHPSDVIALLITHPP
ncbi:hypothetical protein H4582DRAFT_2086977 [Lactarius indigo]|nr:hypothetical protein H4582DRAFT_2086977 [Lactarius indigo]